METLKIGSVGNDVKILQSVLNNVGYGKMDVDGKFGSGTEKEVIRFQSNNNLIPDGVVGPSTWKLIDVFLVGYDNYIVNYGDSFWSIAQKYYTNPKYIQVANPNLNATNLQTGQTIKVPYGIDVVLTDVGYTYEILEKNIKGINGRYPFIEVGTIGESRLGRKIYVLKIGNGPNQVIYNGAHHSLESITSPLLMKFTEEFAKGYVNGTSIRGYNIREIFRNSTIYIVPMVNPDGIELVINGLSKENPNYKKLINWNNGSNDFSKTWNSNNEGVDLNHNYNAGWDEYLKVQEELGITGPGPTKYSGKKPESEPETRSLANFTRNIKPRVTLAYHSQGEVIYWQFEDYATAEAKRLGELLAKVSNYQLKETYGTASYTGYKDWFLQEYQKSGYTVEVGSGVNPLPVSQFPKIYNDNIELLLLASVYTQR